MLYFSCKDAVSCFTSQDLIQYSVVSSINEAIICSFNFEFSYLTTIDVIT